MTPTKKNIKIPHFLDGENQDCFASLSRYRGIVIGGGAADFDSLIQQLPMIFTWYYLLITQIINSSALKQNPLICINYVSY